MVLFLCLLFTWCQQPLENQHRETELIQKQYFYAQGENPFRYVNISPEITRMMREGKDDYEEKEINLTHSWENYLLNWESISLRFESERCSLNNQSYDYKVIVYLSWEVYQWCGNDVPKEQEGLMDEERMNKYSGWENLSWFDLKMKEEEKSVSDLEEKIAELEAKMEVLERQLGE